METETITYADPARVDALVDEWYVRCGYSKVRRDGQTVVDQDKMRAKVVDLVMGKVVPDRLSKSVNAWTQGELYASVFPGAPGTDARQGLDDLDVEDAAVRAKLMRRVWTLTNPDMKGYIQVRLGETSSLVLCRAEVTRGLDQVPGVYVTDDPDLIMSESLQPRIERLVSEAAHLRQHAAMITTRQPQLIARVAAAIGTGTDRARAELGTGNGKAPARPAIDTAS